VIVFVDKLNDTIKRTVLLQPAFSTLIQAISEAKIIENGQKYYNTKQVNFINTLTTTTISKTNQQNKF
jgi:hypothetical protein